MRIQADTQADVQLRPDPVGHTDGDQRQPTANSAKGSFDGPTRSYTDQRQRPAAECRRLQEPAWSPTRTEAPRVRLTDVAHGRAERREHPRRRAWQRAANRARPSSSTSSASPAPASSRPSTPSRTASCPSSRPRLPAHPGHVEVLADRTTGIRASVHHVEIELLLAVVLVVLVIFFFLHSLRATVIASLAVPISLIGSFAGQWYLLRLQPEQPRA
ncbi:efflux RND transporter permease subunit [Caulobacter segnis]